MSEYSWYPSITAPDVAPMRVIDARLALRDLSVMRVPERKILGHTWGVPVTVFLLGETGDFSLPERLSILYFSFLEDCFYGGDITFSGEELSRLWDLGMLHPDSHQKTNYESFIIGLAPQGFVQIWLYGHGVSRTFCTGQTEKVNYDWEKFLNNTNISRADYIDSVLRSKLGNERLIELRTDKLILKSWKDKAEKHKWMPLVTSQLAISGVWIYYVNGDREFLAWENEFRNFDERAIPQSIGISFMTEDDKRHIVKAELSPMLFENTLKKLKNREQKLPLTMHVIIPSIDKKLFVYLSNEHTYISLEPHEVKFYTCR